MKNIFTIIIVFIVCMSFNGCDLLGGLLNSNSDKPEISDEKLAAIGDQIITILPKMFDSPNYEEEITKPLVKPDGCDYIAEGGIGYYQDDELIAIIDFGDGECDEFATKTVGSKVTEFYLSKDYNSDNSGYDKKITKPLIKPDSCDYIVEGTIQYIKNGQVVATVDYGNGLCDEWATKTWDGGSKVFNLDK